MEDWVVFRTWVGDLTQMIADNTVGQTRFHDYSDGVASVMTESIMAVTVLAPSWVQFLPFFGLRENSSLV